MKTLASDPRLESAPFGSLQIDPEWTTRILVEFLSRELHRTGFQKFVLGLSGGIDSALVTYLAARAIAPRNVLAVLMPYRTSSASSLTDAQAVIDDLGIRSEIAEISPMVDGFLASTPDGGDRHRLGNVMARCRMLLLYDRSMREGGLVLGTSNKTELLLGYGTQHGDLASAMNPIGDLYKTQVRQLSRHLGVPPSIVVKPPSADLYPDQSDEEDMGLKYDEVDRLLALLVDARIDAEAVIEAGFPRDLVERVERMIQRSQFKRRPPLVAKVSLRSIGWDFRYPRDWNS